FHVTGVQTCALPILPAPAQRRRGHQAMRRRVARRPCPRRAFPVALRAEIDRVGARRSRRRRAQGRARARADRHDRIRRAVDGPVAARHAAVRACNGDGRAMSTGNEHTLPPDDDVEQSQETQTAADGSSAIAQRFRGFLPVVVDVETGGFNPATDALLEVAAVLVRMNEHGDLEPAETTRYLVKPFPGANLEPASLQVTG